MRSIPRPRLPLLALCCIAAPSSAESSLDSEALQAALSEGLLKARSAKHEVCNLRVREGGGGGSFLWSITIRESVSPKIFDTFFLKYHIFIFPARRARGR